MTRRKSREFDSEKVGRYKLYVPSDLFALKSAILKKGQKPEVDVMQKVIYNCFAVNVACGCNCRTVLNHVAKSYALRVVCTSVT